MLVTDGYMVLLLALFVHQAVANCPGCPGCNYCYLHYPSSGSAQCNAYQAAFSLYCKVAGSSTQSISIAWKVDGLKQPSSSSPACNQLDGTTSVCTSYFTVNIADSNAHTYSCTIVVGGTDLADTDPLRVSSLVDIRTPCSQSILTSNDTICANQSAVCGPPPSSSSGTSVSLPSSSTIAITPTKATVESTSLSNVLLYTSGITTGAATSPTDSVYLTSLSGSTQQARFTATVTHNSTVTTDSSSDSSLTMVWLYVAAGVATVFALTIIVLSILCTVLCLKRSQTADTDTLKSQEPTQSIRMRFSSTGSSFYSSDQPNDSGGQKSKAAPATTGNVDRDYDVITPLPTTQQYSHLHRPSLSPSPPQLDYSSSHQRNFCTTSTVLTDLGNTRASGEPPESTDIATNGTNGQQHNFDVPEALYCITSLSSLNPKANQIWSSPTQPIPPLACTSSAAPSSSVVYHILESTAAERDGTSATEIVGWKGTFSGATDLGFTQSSENSFKALCPFQVHDYEHTPFPDVPYETPVPSNVQNGKHCGTTETCSPDYSFPPDAIAAESSAKYIADYSEPSEQSGDVGEIQTMTSQSNLQKIGNYEVLSAATLDPKSCYTRLKLGKHTVV